MDSTGVAPRFSLEEAGALFFAAIHARTGAPAVRPPPAIRSVTDLSIASWNINSVRLRAPLIRKFAGEAGPDILLLQEIKCRNGEFPSRALDEAGFPHVMVRGQKGWHGVAIASKHPIEALESPAFCRAGEARHAAARIRGMEIHNFYVPAGGDEPDPDANPRFAHKLDFVERMTAYFAERRASDPDAPIVIGGDLNIAPHENDVWSHRQLLKVVSHTPPETERLAALRESFDFVDVARALYPEEEKLYSWWSYRNRDWKKSNRGRRLDHLWVGPALKDAATAGGADNFRFHRHARDWEKPSDHVPIEMRLTL